MDSTMPKVSIIIPTRNRAWMLRRAVRSVLAQTYQDFELIVVSDGSTDTTDKAIASFDDPRIHFLRYETARGASAARNTGLRAAKGTYLAFLDDDDEWLPKKLELQMPIVESSRPEVGLIYGWMEIFENGRSIRVHAPQLRGNVFAEMLDKQAIGGCPTVIIKREVLDKVGYFDEQLPRGNDGDFMRRISKHFEVDYVPEVLAKVNVGHADRITTINRKGVENEIFALRKRLETFQYDFQRYPDKRASVLAKIAVDYFIIAKLKDGLIFLSKAVRTRCGFRVKCRHLLANGKYGLSRLTCR